MPTRSSEWLDAVLDTALDAIVIVEQGALVAWNQRLIDLLSVAPDALKACRFARFADLVANRVTAPSAFEDRVRWLEKHPDEPTDDLLEWNDGRSIRCTSRSHPAGRVWRLRDVTAERRALREVRESEERYRSLYDRTPAIMHSIDSKGRLVSVSDAWLDAFGYTREEVIGHPSVEFLTPASRKYASEVVLPAYFATGSCRDIAYQFVKKTGEIVDVELSAICERDEQGAIVRSLAVLLDVTQRKKADRVRDDFLAIAAHELKTPLTPLALQIHWLEKRLRDRDPEDAVLASKAIKQLGRLTSLLDDLLDVSRIEAGRLGLHLETLSMSALVRRVVEDARTTSHPERTIVLEVGEDALVEGDRARLEQVVTNLLENGLKYSAEERPVRVVVGAERDEVIVAVEDQGIGIPLDEQAMLFQRFFRAANAPVSGYGGLGLGLYIVRDLVERHGGRIRVESEPGRGSRFIISLPRKAG